MNNKQNESEQVAFFIVSFKGNNSMAIALENHLEGK
jgi:hypothetical protein